MSSHDISHGGNVQHGHDDDDDARPGMHGSVTEHPSLSPYDSSHDISLVRLHASGGNAAQCYRIQQRLYIHTEDGQGGIVAQPYRCSSRELCCLFYRDESIRHPTRCSAALGTLMFSLLNYGLLTS